MVKEKTEKKLLEEINRNLTHILGLLAVQGLPDSRKIDVLSDLGFSSDFISKLVGISPGAVRKSKSRRRKRKKQE